MFTLLFNHLDITEVLIAWLLLKVINNDRGVHMRPMPGMVGLISSSSKVYFLSPLDMLILGYSRISSLLFGFKRWSYEQYCSLVMGKDNVFTFLVVLSSGSTFSDKNNVVLLPKDPFFLPLRIKNCNVYCQFYTSRIRREHNQLNNQTLREPGGIVGNWKISCSSYLKDNQIGP